LNVFKLFKLRPFKNVQFWKHKMSYGAKSGEYSGCSKLTFISGQNLLYHKCYEIFSGTILVQDFILFKSLVKIWNLLHTFSILVHFYFPKQSMITFHFTHLFFIWTSSWSFQMAEFVMFSLPSWNRLTYTKTCGVVFILPPHKFDIWHF